MRVLAPWAEKVVLLMRMPVALLSLAALLVLAAPFAWMAELVSHFAWQLLLTGFACGLVLALTGRCEGRPVLLVALAIVQVIFVYPVARAHAPPPAPASAQLAEGAPLPLRLLHFNAHTSNPDKARTVEEIVRADADLVVVQEVNQAWLDRLKRGLSNYEVLAASARSDNFGMVVFAHARVAQARAQIHQDAWEVGVPTIEIEAPGLRVLAVHTLPPLSTSYARRRDAQLEGIATWSQAHADTARIVVGDLNVSVYSPRFRALQTDAGLVDARRSAEVFARPTFPAGALGWVLGIPIDQVLLSPELGASSFEVQDDWGSDHRAVLAVVVDAR